MTAATDQIHAPGERSGRPDQEGVVRGVLSVGGRCRRLIGAAALMVVVVVAGLSLSATPAAANWDWLPGRVTLDCVVLTQGNTYRAVFGYENNTHHTITIPVGPFNHVNPKSVNGMQVTKFKPGTHRAAFATRHVSRNQRITWTVGLSSATATASSPRCGPSVELPAEGNGMAPVLVVAGSVVAALVGLRVRRWRLRRGN